MAKRIVRHGRNQRQAARALEDALDPIEEAHLAAKENLWAARESGDRAAIRAAKQQLVEASNRLEETRTWLRREAEVVKLQTVTIPELERALQAAKDDDKQPLQLALEAAKAELEAVGGLAAQTRRQLEQLGGVVAGPPVPADLPPGSADVTLPPISTRAVVNRRKEQ